MASPPIRSPLRGLTRMLLFALLLMAGSVMSATSSQRAAAAEPAGGTFTLRVPVLMYHRISEAPPDAALPGLWVTPARFRHHLVVLKRNGWESVTAEEVVRHLAARELLPPRRFVISIDDGALDGYTHAAPILDELGMHATYYVNPGFIGRGWQMTWPQLRELRDGGHEIASHALTHADLPTLSDAELQHQVVGAQKRFERLLGARPVTFCYPFGHHDAAVRRAVRDAGLRLAFTTEYGARESTSDRFRAPRIRISSWDRASSVLARLQPYAIGH